MLLSSVPCAKGDPLHGALPSPSAVSIVIPTFNHAHFLRTAIESALSQTIAPAEVIVVDDGSNDGADLVVRDFPQVKYIRQDNSGLAAARNAGWRSSRGEYIVFLDADDLLLPDALRVNLAQFAAHPTCGLVYAGYRRIERSGAISTVSFQDIGADPYLTLLRGNVIGMHGTVMYRRASLEATEGFNPALRACEDYELYLRIARVYPIRGSRHPVADYRQHGANMSLDCGMMLRTALMVLDLERPFASRDQQKLAALNQGRTNWKRYYSREQMIQLHESIRNHISARLIISTIVVWAKAPVTMWEVLLRRAARKFRPTRFIRRKIDFGDLRRTTPVSKEFGFDRGTPIDRYYIEKFLSEFSEKVRGCVLEIGDDSYTKRFGATRVQASHVFNRFPGFAKTSFTGDLSGQNDLPVNVFDCIIITQTLQLIYNMSAAIETLWNSLRPGGVLLVTVPWLSPIDRGEWRNSWYWSLTPAALFQLLNVKFDGHTIEVRAYGNVLSGAAFLYGLATDELTSGELDAEDSCCPVLVAAVAIKT